MNEIDGGLLRTLAFRAAEGYPPSFYEWITQAEVHRGIGLQEVEAAAKALIREGKVKESRGRVVLPGCQKDIAEHEQRRALFHAKMRKAKKVAKWLASQTSVRFIALCNTTALAHAREDSDLDFFVITSAGTIWQTRLISAAPYKLLGKRPGARESDADAVCLSFFIDETTLSLEGLQLTKYARKQDPYLRYWFLSLLPLYDDGIARTFWKENAWVTETHGLATEWIAHPDFKVRSMRARLPSFRFMEHVAKRMQSRAFPKTMLDAANQDTSVVINDHILKFHTVDRRASFRDTYESICQTIHISP